MKKKSKLRLWVQMGFFIIIALISISHTLHLSYFKGLSLRAFCPFGVVTSLCSILTSNEALQPKNLTLIAIIFFLSFLLGSFFCGWICPLGSVQEWIGKIGQKIWGKRYNHRLPERVAYYLGFLRYVVLGFVVYIAAQSGNLLLTQLDPYHVLFRFWTGDIAVGAAVVLLLTLAASLFIERPWCKFACPLGAILGLFNKIRIFPIRRNPEICVSCRRCSTICPMNIPVEKMETVRDARCISCMKCISGQACPKPEALYLGLRPLISSKNPVKLREKHVAILILLVFVLGVGSAILLGYWQNKTLKHPQLVLNEELNPADIRGSYSFADVISVLPENNKLSPEEITLANVYEIDKIKTGSLVQ